MSGVTTLPECEQLCPNCERSGYENNAWCQNCGYYAVLGRCIEIDHVWEEQCRDADDAAESAPQPSLLSGILMIPGWMWQLFALILLLTAFAVLFHLGVAEGSASRIVGAVAIVLVSGITLAAAHVYAGVQVAREDIDFQPMDILMRPLRLWVTALSRLPRNFKCTAFATGSLWTLLVVHLIVGVPYSQLQDLSAPSKRPGVPKAMLSLDAGGSEDMTLEEAMEAFTDAAVKTGQDEDEEEPALTLGTVNK